MYMFVPGPHACMEGWGWYAEPCTLEMCQGRNDRRRGGAKIVSRRHAREDNGDGQCGTFDVTFTPSPVSNNGIEALAFLARQIRA